LKAVIMAGGEGTRLRPITCDLPKPMVQVLGKPVMEYTIELLKKYGITEIAVTLHYLPDVIRGWFGDGVGRGVNLQYFVEDEPLGTAGSVRAAREFLNESFIVISGDALTDIDLGLAMEFHRQKQADVTIVLKSVETPVEFGVVIAGGDGQIERFMEKPAWQDVFSDTVNTGIYIIEPQVMDRIAPGAKADFSKDLFPALMAANARLFGYLAEGYWCDIGNPAQYAAAQFDILDHRVHVDVGLPEGQPGVFIHPSANIADGATLVRPCAVLEGAAVNAGSVVGPYAVIGRECIVEKSTSLEHTVLLDGVLVGTACHLEGSVVCDGAALGERARVHDGAVIGAGARVGSDSVIDRNVSIWPGITVERHASVRHTQQRGSRYPQSLFDDYGISGTFNDDISAESTARLAMALGSAFTKGNRVGIATWGDNAAILLREAFDAGLLSTGVCCVDMGELALPAARFAAKRLRLDGAVHIHSFEGQVTITVMDGKGANIDTAHEKKIEENLTKGSFRKAKNDDIADIIGISGVGIFYEQELYGGVAAAALERTIGIYGPDESLNQQAERVLEGMGYACKSCSTDGSLQQAAQRCVAEGMKMGLYQQKAGNEFAFIDELGSTYEGDKLAVMLAMVAMDRGISTGTVPLPVMANMGFESMAEKKGINVERTPAGRSDWLRHACHSTDERMCYLFYDGVYAAMSLAETLAMEGLSLSAYAARIPETFTHQQYVDCPLEKRGNAMKTLYTEFGSSEAFGGALLNHEKGRVFITPDKQSSRFKVLTEAASEEYAEELAVMFQQVIDGIAKS
jgi:mannose-1-phosphate guanylyltransferase / phosphomannomutase